MPRSFFWILNKKYFFEFAEEVVGPISEIYSSFPDSLPSTLPENPPLELICKEEDFLIYGPHLESPQVIIKFEGTIHDTLMVWTHFSTQKIRKSFELNILRVLQKHLLDIEEGIIIKEQENVKEKVFDKINAIIRFQDTFYKNRKVGGRSTVILDKNFIKIVGKRFIWNQGVIIIFTEDDLHQILDKAKEYSVSWRRLLNIKIDFGNITGLEFKYQRDWKSSLNLFIYVSTHRGPISIELEKKKFSASTPSNDLREIDIWIRKHLPDSHFEKN